MGSHFTSPRQARIESEENSKFIGFAAEHRQVKAFFGIEDCKDFGDGRIKLNIHVDAVGSEEPGDVAHLFLGCTTTVLWAFAVYLHEGRRSELKRRTGYELCDMIEAWLKNNGWEKLSVLEVLQAQSCPFVDRATAFLSHAQQETILSTCDLRQIPDDTCLFIDYLTVRQCQQGDFKPSMVEAVISEIGCTYIALCPVICPALLSRAWCVYEISCSLNANVQLHIAPHVSDVELDLANPGVAAALKELGSNWLSAADAMTVDLTNCVAREEADKEMIMRHVEDGVGIQQANLQVKEAVQAQLREAALKHLNW